MLCPTILAHTLSTPNLTDKYGNHWQYHSLSDRHSKIACCGILIDLLAHCPLLRAHVAAQKVAFGINHEMRDFQNDRKKSLDLVICTPATPDERCRTLPSLIEHYNIALQAEADESLKNLPVMHEAPVGAVLLALEAKACMTAHQRALPRLYDELNSSHLTVHGATDHAIAAGFVMINGSETYLSPDLNKADRISRPQWSRHKQLRDASLVVEKVKKLPRRSRMGMEGYDALAIVLVNCINDGSEVTLLHQPPAPQIGDIYEYTSMIHRLANLYATRFAHL